MAVYEASLIDFFYERGCFILPFDWTKKQKEPILKLQQYIPGVRKGAVRK